MPDRLMARLHAPPLPARAEPDPPRDARATRFTTPAVVAASIPCAIALVAFFVFSPALRNNFVEWDDSVNLLTNYGYRGLGLAQLRWMLTSTLMGHYIPVTWLSFGLDYTLWGMDPFGYHLTNVVLHALNAALFYLVGLRIVARATASTQGERRLAAATAALFFALHPLRAESVAWATERRDILSSCFFLLTVLTYLRALDVGGRRRRVRLAASLGCYVLALLSKSIVMTLPLVLVLLDVYPLGRLRSLRGAWATPGGRALLAEKLPYLLVGLAGGITSYLAVALNDYLTPLERYPWPARIGMVAYSLWFYVAKTLIPASLSALYELPARVDPLASRFLVPAVASVAVTGLLLALRRRCPGPLAAWIYYGLILGPVSGLVHAGHQLAHDRYSYLSCLGWALLVGAGVAGAARAGRTGAIRPWAAGVAMAGMAVWLFALATLTWYQVQVWRDTETLWRHAAESVPACARCQTNVGNQLLSLHLPALALERFEVALRLRPDQVRWHANAGKALTEEGDYAQALTRFDLALARYPDAPDILSDSAVALINQRRLPEAIARLEHALRVDPAHVQALTNLGVALIEAGEPERSLGYLLRALELEPDQPAIRLNLARAYLGLDRVDAAREQYRIVSARDPRLVRAIDASLLRP